jgi:hypothetical protein
MNPKKRITQVTSPRVKKFNQPLSPEKILVEQNQVFHHKKGDLREKSPFHAEVLVFA